MAAKDVGMLTATVQAEGVLPGVVMADGCCACFDGSGDGGHLGDAVHEFMA